MRGFSCWGPGSGWVYIGLHVRVRSLSGAVDIPAVRALRRDDAPLPAAARVCQGRGLTLDEFRQTLSAASPPLLSPLLRALWHDANGDWDEAHRIAQDVSGADAAWVHAYLHRKEGDLSNARYWYHQAGKEPGADALESEWQRIVTELLSRP